MNNPLVSVAIPTHNREKYLPDAIKSVLNQTYQNIELIVVNDGSTDNTENIVLDFALDGQAKKDKRIVYIRNDKNLGFVKTIRKGIEIAKGKYIARIDDDDVWIDSRKLEKQVNFLETNKDYVLVGSAAVKTVGKEKEKFLPPEKDQEIRKVILIKNIFFHSAVVFPRELYLRAGGYKEEFGFFADWELWLGLGKFGKFYNFPDFFVSYSDEADLQANNSHDKQIRRKLKEALKMKKFYSNLYPNYNKAIVRAFASYIYSFLPLRNTIKKWIKK